MSLVFAGLVPHTPLLLPYIGKEQAQKLTQTNQAFLALSQEIYAARLDTVLVISAHAGMHDQAFTLYGNEMLRPNLSEFGDLQPYEPFFNELSLVSHIRERAAQENIPIAIQPQEELDYASAVPLLLLRRSIRKDTVLVLGTSAASRKEHFDFGYLLKDIVMNTTKRVGVLVSCNLSHALLTDSPSGYSPSSEKFDMAIRQNLEGYNATGLLQMDETMAQEAVQCALPAILMFLGLMQRVDYSYKELSYEYPFGVGYLTAQFVLP